MYFIHLVGAGNRIHPGYTSPILQLLNDVNSPCLLVASYAIVRAGRLNVTRASCNRNLLMVIVAMVILDALLYANGFFVDGFNNADTLLRPWSMATSVFP